MSQTLQLKYKFSLLNFAVMFVLCVFFATHAKSQRTATVTGNWNSSSTWSGGVIPASTDAVIINAGVTVTVDVASAQCASLTVNANSVAVNCGIFVSSTNSLSVTSSITIVVPTAAASSVIDAGAGTITTGTIVLNGSGTASRLSVLQLSTGTINCNAITIGGTAAQTRVTFSGSGIINVGNATTGTMGAPGVFTASTGTVNYNGAAQTITALTYNHLNLSGSGAKTVNAITVSGNLNLSGTANATTAGVFTVNGNLNLASSSTLSIAGFNATITGTTTIDGRLSNTSTTGNKSFLGPVFVKNGGVFTETVAEQIDFGSDVTIENGGSITENGTAVMTYMGNFQNDGTYTASTGIHRFGGASKTIGGANAILMPTVTFTAPYTNTGTLTSATLLTVTSTTLTNNGTVTSTSDLAGSGTFLQGSSGLLNITANSNITH